MPFASKVSWSAALAGAVTMLAVAILLWGLAIAIVALTSRPFVSFHGSAVVLWISAMVVTLIGAIAGGYTAGFLSRDQAPELGAMHGFLGWAVALLAAFLVQFSVAKTLWTTVAQATPETAAVTSEAPAGAAELQQGTIPPGDGLAAPPRPHEHLIVLSWSWFGTWFLAAILAAAAGNAGGWSLGRTGPSNMGPNMYPDDMRPGGPYGGGPFGTAYPR
jgi:hypothetical protein